MLACQIVLVTGFVLRHKADNAWITLLLVTFKGVVLRRHQLEVLHV